MTDAKFASERTRRLVRMAVQDELARQMGRHSGSIPVRLLDVDALVDAVLSAGALRMTAADSMPVSIVLGINPEGLMAAWPIHDDDFVQAANIVHRDLPQASLYIVDVAAPRPEAIKRLTGTLGAV